MNDQPLKDKLLEFIGYLSVAFPELRGVTAERLLKAVNDYTNSPDPGPPPEQEYMDRAVARAADLGAGRADYIC